MQKKKLIALLLLVTMLFTLVPTAALAETDVVAEQDTALFSDGVSITVTSGSAVQLFSQDGNNYYKYTEYPGAFAGINEDGNEVYTFTPDTIGNLNFRVSKDGYITKAGKLDSIKKIDEESSKIYYEILYTENDLYSNIKPTASCNENDILLNVQKNTRNNIQLAEGESYDLRALRSWQIVGNTISNFPLIEPDFQYKIVAGDENCIAISASNIGNAKNNSLKINAIQKGTAIVEVSYDAIHLVDKGANGIYGASVPERTGLIVVQVGDATADADFGIQCYSSSALEYTEENAQPWDSEFDTIYFIGESGLLNFAPTIADGSISSVAYSNDKGETWQDAIEKDGVYTANITSGNNLLRVKKTDGTAAYQVVRGSSVEVRITNQTKPGEKLEAGDTVRVTLEGLHIPVNKLAGIYNPTFSGANLTYLFDETRIKGNGRSQFDFATKNNYIEVTFPENRQQEFYLTDGYIFGGVFGSNLGEHRKLDEKGMPPNLVAGTGKYTRSILPDITLYIGQEPSANRAPELTGAAVAEKTISKSDTYRLFVNQFFTDADNDALTYSVSVNGAAAQKTSADYQFKPNTAGTYTLVFKANDGQADSPAYTVTLTVEGSSSGGGDIEIDSDFDMNGQPIAGYVTMSFEDYAKRPAGSKVPVALGTIIAPVEVPYAAGETVAAVTLRLLDAYNMDAEYSGTVTEDFYLSSIETRDGWLGEFDAGSGSGWMYSRNSAFPEIGAADVIVEDDDTIRWQYTSDLGEDIGGGTGAAKPEDDKIPAELPSTGAGVGDLIDTIGNIDKNSGELLQAARTAYDNLTAEEQKLVKNYDKLLAAEREYGRLTNPLPFNDVKEQHWAKEAIQYIYSKDLMNGTRESAFEPEAELSRGMLVTILYRLEGAPAVTARNTFSDVTDRDWFTNAVLWANANNLVSGYGDGKFGANDAITREQLASILMRYSQYKQYDVSKKANLNGFADKGQISSWAEGSIAWAKAEGLLNGRTATTIAPQGEVTRAETAAILMRYLQKVEQAKIK